MAVSVYRIIIFSLIMSSFVRLSAQSDILEGSVSFITSQNIYVRFNSTSGIGQGDTLLLDDNKLFRPCLLVQQKSSTSCVCILIEDCTVDKGDKVFFRTLKPDLPASLINEEEPDELVQESEVFDVDSVALELQDPLSQLPEQLEKIRARISASTYSTFDPDYGDRHRSMLRMSLDVDNINNSRFSFESYINYRRNFGESPSVSSLGNSFLRLYNLNLSYQADSSMTFTLGRKINRKMSSVGAIDGLQFDKSFGGFYTGAIIGFRPDIIAFDFNPSLLEYGVYFGTDIRRPNSYGQFTFGILEQRNGAAIDRRYSYLQFSNTLYRNLNLFASAEFDLYSFDTQAKSYSPQLTNIYLSARYRLSRRISISMAYDARKRIIYYETLRTDLERLLDDDETRQGIRLRINFKPIQLVYAGISYSKRFQSDNQNKSDNINGFASLARIPGIGGRLILNYNQNKSNYLNSQIISLRHSRTIFRNILEADFYYRNVNYNYFNTETVFKQYYIGAGLSWIVMKDISFNFLIEQSHTGDQDKYRMNTKLIKRFR